MSDKAQENLLELAKYVDHSKEALYYGRIINQETDIDNNQDAIDQLDNIDSATVEYAEKLTKTTGLKIELTIEQISDINDMVLEYLAGEGIPIWNPINTDGGKNDD